MVAAVFDRDVIRIGGAEAASYLQGQISQDVDGLAVSDSTWSLALQPNGKLVAWFRLHRMGDNDFLIDVESGWGEALLARLVRFKLRTDVTFAAEEGWRMLSVRGDGAAPPKGELSAPVDWPGFGGVDVLSDSFDSSVIAGCDADAFEQTRVRAGVPVMGTDLTVEMIPGEGGAQFIAGAVSFTKGCFTGQELVARINSRGGNVPRPLRRLEAAGPLAVGAAVMHEGSEVGTVTSTAGPWALGPVMRKVEPGSTVEVDGVATVVRDMVEADDELGAAE